MTAVTEVLNPNFMLLVYPHLTVNVLMYFQTEMTPWHRVFLEKLIVDQFVKKVSTFI
jgi:hypothetical protein